MNKIQILNFMIDIDKMKGIELMNLTNQVRVDFNQRVGSNTEFRV